MFRSSRHSGRSDERDQATRARKRRLKNGEMRIVEGFEAGNEDRKIVRHPNLTSVVDAATPLTAQAAHLNK